MPMEAIHKILMDFSKKELINLITYLLGKLDDDDRINFISKNINAQIALEEIGEDDSLNFLRKVDIFCKDCLDGDYYVEPEYDDYYDYEITDNFVESVWAKKFSEYLNITVMHSRNSNYDVSYKAFDMLMDCLHEAEFDEEILGTENPMDYIKVEWTEVFDGYYASIKNHLDDEEQIAEKAVEVWVDFGERCTEPILKYLDSIVLVEKAIVKNIETIVFWEVQHLLYELLRKFYIKSGKEFNEINTAGSFLKYNVNFYNDIAKGYLNLGMWNEAIEVIKKALPRIETKEVAFALNEKLVYSYEKLGMFGEAFDIALRMFYTNNTHELYKRARFFAEKLGDVDNFVNNIEKYLLSHNGYYTAETLIRILSFEGRTEKLVDTALKSKGYSHYSYLKYTSKSLIYRALGHESTNLPNLNEYIQSIEQDKIDGIVDMVTLPEDADKKEGYLNTGIEILKLMVQFHIDAAKRSRYQRAAYYCSMIKDIYSYLNRENEFANYYSGILYENNRRPALKDEMKRRIGK